MSRNGLKQWLTSSRDICHSKVLFSHHPQRYTTEPCHIVEHYRSAYSSPRTYEEPMLNMFMTEWPGPREVLTFVGSISCNLNRGISYLVLAYSRLICNASVRHASLRSATWRVLMATTQSPVDSKHQANNDKLQRGSRNHATKLLDNKNPHCFVSL